jgi:hypothetical protein
MKPIFGSFLCAAVATLLSTTAVLHGQIYNEQFGDAGQTLGTAQNSGITQTGTIFGQISGINDADVYRITITNTSTISFSTLNALTLANGGAGGMDTQLFIFTSTGLPVYANDDATGLTVQSFLPAGNSLLATLSPGTYYLAISLSGNDPINLNSQLVFATGATTSIRGPANSINPTTWNTFDNAASFAQNGQYEIDIIPEPSTVALYLAGAVVLLGVTLRRRTTAAKN